MKQWIKCHKRTIIILLILLALKIWDFADPPLWWQFGAQDNKRAILAYVNEKYPGAKIVRQSYPSTQFNPTNVPQDIISFQYDNVQFVVTARQGELMYDSFYKSKASQFIENEYLKNFFNMGSIPQHHISFEGNPCEDLSQYTGDARLYLIVSKEDGYNKPEDIVWAYDFFVFWKENCIIPKYYIFYTLNIHNGERYTMTCSQDSDFLNAKDFFDAFEHFVPMNTNLNQHQSN